MTEDREFQRFSCELDEEWFRQRLRSALPARLDPAEEEGIARALEAADPLRGASGASWIASIRQALGVWPGRLTLAASACVLLLIGFVLGRAPAWNARGQVAMVPPPLPAYQPDRGMGLGLAASIRPESERKFREAIAFHGAPDFASKALPLLREAVSEDPSNDQAQFWLGVVLLLQRKGADAVAPLEAAVKIAPASSLYRQYLLFAYLQTGARAKGVQLQSDLLRQP